MRGIETGANAYSTSSSIQKRLSPQVRAELMARGRQTNDPILELPPGTEAKAPWRDHPAFLARAPDPRALWETAWPRDRAAFTGPKVIALHRTDRGRFALDEAGKWQPSNRATVVTPHASGQSVAYLCGLLNSELLDLWYAMRGRTPRDVWRDYEPKPMGKCHTAMWSHHRIGHPAPPSRRSGLHLGQAIRRLRSDQQRS